MGHLLNARRRQILAKGRRMVLRRLPSSGVAQQEVVLLGFSHGAEAGEVDGPIQPGDLIIETLHDEIAASDWPAPPAKPDRIIDGGQQLAVQGRGRPIYEGGTVIGWRIWVRG
jgi:hypothetical protein